MKTVQYNDISEYEYTQLYDFEFMLEEFKKFVKEGGNLNLDVKSKSDKIIPFEEWFRSLYSENSHYFKILIDEKLIENPFQFKVDHENKTIKDIPDYGLHWLKNNFIIYKPYILNAIKDLSIEIQDWELGEEYFVLKRTPKTLAELLEKHEEIAQKEKKIPTYMYIDHSGYTENKYTHPLITIIKTFEDVSVYEEILSSNPKYKKLFKNEHSQEGLLDLIERLSFKNEDILSVLYKHEIIDDILHSEKYKTSSTFSNVVAHLIQNNEIDVLKKNLQHIDFVALEYHANNNFLKLSPTREMTEFLLDNNVIAVGKLEDPTKENNAYVKTINTLRESSNLDTFQLILERDDKYIKMIKEEPHNFYELIRDRYNNKVTFEKLKLITEKYNFPLNTIEALELAESINIFETLPWMIEHGIDPRKCKEFIYRCSDKRASGLKTLKELKKQNLFNSYYPDPLYHILSYAVTKDFFNWIEKAPDEQFNRLTKEGVPAWWGFTNTHGFNLILKKVKSFDQLSTGGCSYLYHIIKTNPKRSYSPEFDPYRALEKIHKELEGDFKITGVDENNNNIFHHLFKYNEYNKKNIDEKYTAYILQSKEPIGELLTQKNKFGVVPLELLSKFLNLNYHNDIRIIKQILSKSFEQVDYEQPLSITLKEVKNKEVIEHPIDSVLSFYQHVFKDDEDSLSIIKKFYESKKLYRELNQELVNTNVEDNTPKTSTKKIKI